MVLPINARSSRPGRPSDLVVAIGASTGGPQALYRVMRELPADLPAPVAMVQHMPAGFTRSLAEHLDAVSALRVVEAAGGERLEPGTAIVAPGGHHLVFDAQRRAKLLETPPLHGVRPAVDVMLESVASLAGVEPLAVVLTGMGRDGARGCRAIREAGGWVIAEDASTCVIYGMPRAVAEAGLADEVVPLDGIADAIVRYVQSPRPGAVRREGGTHG